MSNQKLAATFVILLGILMLGGCNFRESAPPPRLNSYQWLPGPREAAEMSYRFAFSGQVLNDVTLEPVSDFTVDVVGRQPSVRAVVNALGDRNGMFHLSRVPALRDGPLATLPIVITAPGYEPVVQMLGVGADCRTGGCAGIKALPFYLRRSSDAVRGVPDNAALVPVVFSNETAKRGVAPIFRELVATGKIDPLTEKLLASSKNRDLLTNMLVLFNTNSAASTESVKAILNSIRVEKLTSIAKFLSLGETGNRLVTAIAARDHHVAQAFAASNVLLPYLGALKDDSIPLAQLIGQFAKGADANENIAMLALLARNATAQTDPALAGFFSIEASLAARNRGTRNPFENILGSILGAPGVYSALSNRGSVTYQKPGDMSLALSYLAPLVQGLLSKSSAEVAQLLNSLAAEGGLDAIKSFPLDMAQADRYARLIPYIEPLVGGLNGKDAVRLTTLLHGAFMTNNPAGAIERLVTDYAGKNMENLEQMAAVLFPAVKGLLSKNVPAKQVFAAQLITGLLGEDFKDVAVIQDLKGMPGVIVSGQARDIFKLAQFPNVKRILALGAN